MGNRSDSYSRIGDTYGRLTVKSIEYRPVKSNRGYEAYAVCECCCDGRQWKTRMTQLVSGKTRSCGCLQREFAARSRQKQKTHGLSRTPEYQAWGNMIIRATDESFIGHAYYVDRGISVCQRWVDSFQDFLADMGPRPGKGYSIDRIDNDGNYEPGNCRWATRKQQGLNKRTNRVIEFRGAKKTLTELCEEFGFKIETLRCRLIRGWDIETAIATPLKKDNFRSKKAAGGK